jgi:phosphoglycolate phosphatase
MGRPLAIFDFDGTVADSFTESLAAYNRVAPRLRLRPVAEHEVPALRCQSAGKLMTTLAIPMWKLPRLMIAVRADLMDHFHTVRPFPGIEKSLRDLAKAGHRLAVVTSNSLANVQAFLARHDLEVFGTIVAGSSIFGKATRLRRLLKAGRADASSSVYIGDTTPDIRAAREAGTTAVAVTWGFSAREPLAEENPDALVEHTGDLADVVSKLLRVGA